MSSYTIVVARYNESLDWLDNMKTENIVIYNKGEPIDRKCIKRPNIGREGETFLYHIINNYDNLPDYLILLQGNPFDHFFSIFSNNIVLTSKNLQSAIDNYIQLKVTEITPLFIYYLRENKPYKNILSDRYYKLFFNHNMPEFIQFAPGCQYIIPKKSILNRPLTFYKRIHYMLLNSPIITCEEAHNGEPFYDPNSIHGWCLERLFLSIFRTEIPISDFMK